MLGAKKPLRTFFLKVVDTLGIGVPLRNSFHYFNYAADLRSGAKNRRFIRGGGGDGFPFPPPRLIYRVAAHFDFEQFYRSGQWSAEFIQATLRKHGLRIEEFATILDFGCGCGRVFRHWNSLTGPELHGCDYQRPLVRWCQKNLSFGRFEHNGLSAPLNYPSRTFGFIYAISVFTHLDERGQFFWMGELERVLMDRGYLLMTVHGTTRLAELSPVELKKFQAGQQIIHQERYSGANACATYHPQKYIKDVLGRRLELVEFLPGGARDANQDAFLFKRA